MTADAVGGVWTYALDLAAGLRAQGYETVLAVYGPSPSQIQAKAAEACGVELVDTGLPLDWTATESAAIEEAAAATRGLARAMRADLVHLNSPALAVGGGFSVPVLGACHSCLATWWSAVKEGPPPEDFRWRSRMAWRGMTACDALLAPTAAFAEATARTYDTPRPYVVHNGRASHGSPARSRERFAFTSGRLWDEGKNAGVLGAAAKLLDAPIIAAGPTRALDGAAFTNAGDLQLLGALPAPDVRAWLARAPVFVSSALYEPFGLGVLEAAQAGCALVLSDIPTFRELWSDAAVFVPANDAPGYAAAVQGLLDAPEEAARLGAAAEARARRFSLERMAAGTAAIYRQLTSAGVARTRGAAA